MHHLRFAEQRHWRKVSDEFTVLRRPIANFTSAVTNSVGGNLNVDPLDTAQRLWRATHQASEAHQQF
jgi:hypothetical protein